jgi:dTDP-4-amino-4,6-dideoxygalactose transaminase
MKTSVFQLAAFGGVPLYDIPLHVGQPNMPHRESLLSEIEEVLNSGILTNHGPRVRAFEDAVCSEAGTRHCIAVCNATTALQIAAKAMRLRGEVIMPAFTFIATAHAMEWIGLTPVFADVDPLTHTLDPESAASCITSETTAILPVHLWGNVCDVPGLAAVASEHNLRLLFDSSHAFGCRLNGQRVGGFGDAEVFSFHATKFVNSFEGGAIVTNNDELAERCRRLRGFGITDLTEVSDVGINGKMHEISAAAGLVSIASLPEILAANHRNRIQYSEQLRDLPGIRLLAVSENLESNLQYVVVLVDETVLGISRDQLVGLLRAEGVFVRSYFVPGCHRSVPYTNSAGNRHQRIPLPVTESLLGSVMQLPTGMAVQSDDICILSDLLNFVVQNRAEIRRQLMVRSGRICAHASDPSKPRDQKLREAG